LPVWWISWRRYSVKRTLYRLEYLTVWMLSTRLNLLLMLRLNHSPVNLRLRNHCARHRFQLALPQIPFNEDASERLASFTRKRQSKNPHSHLQTRQGILILSQPHRKKSLIMCYHSHQEDWCGGWVGGIRTLPQVEISPVSFPFFHYDINGRAGEFNNSSLLG
jgi:hypothetical protein